MRVLCILLLLVNMLYAELLSPWKLKGDTLSHKERAVIVDKATQSPYVGKYLHHKAKGVYTCKVCDTALYRSTDKFDSHCGWPSFDDEIKGAIKYKKDADGKRTEILCAKCNAHLGHLFLGEHLTAKNRRHCVNSISLSFAKTQDQEKSKREAKAYFAGGCFWGVEYYLEGLKGVKSATSGYMGGKTKNPSYQEVSHKDTGHLESVEVVYDPTQISYETLAKTFFEIHDPTQGNRQGPDVGTQYASAVFVSTPAERQVIERLILQLEKKGHKVTTQVRTYKPFYPAEAYHQDHYKHKGTKPYCHGYTKRF